MLAGKLAFRAITKILTAEPKKLDDDILAFVVRKPKTEQQIAQHLGISLETARPCLSDLVDAGKLAKYDGHTQQKRLQLYCLPTQSHLIEQFLAPTRTHSIKQLNDAQLGVIELLQAGPLGTKDVATKLNLTIEMASKRLRVLAEPTNFRPAYVRVKKVGSRCKWELVK
jgi:predicted transcriptional regulator